MKIKTPPPSGGDGGLESSFSKVIKKIAIPQFTGRPDRDEVITEDEITNLKIDLNYPVSSVSSFFDNMGWEVAR